MNLRTTLVVKAPSSNWAINEIKHRASNFGLRLDGIALRHWNGTDGTYVAVWSLEDMPPNEAYSLVASNLNNWFTEDLGRQPPYPIGSLLWWATRKETTFNDKELTFT